MCYTRAYSNRQDIRYRRILISCLQNSLITTGQEYPTNMIKELKRKFKIYNSYLHNQPTFGEFIRFLMRRKYKLPRIYYHQTLPIKSKLFYQGYYESPFELISIDPDDVRYSSLAYFDRWDCAGAIISGEWDQTPYISDKKAKEMSSREETFEPSFKNNIVYKSLRQRYEQSFHWEDTDIYQFTLRKIDQGEVFWNGCSDIRDVENRCEMLDSLHDSMKQNGFSPQSSRISKSEGFYKFHDEITINIGRTGELLRNSGQHRLGLAKILDIDEIPVRICVIHEDWVKKGYYLRPTRPNI